MVQGGYIEADEQNRLLELLPITAARLQEYAVEEAQRYSNCATFTVAATFP